MLSAKKRQLLKQNFPLVLVLLVVSCLAPGYLWLSRDTPQTRTLLAAPTTQVQVHAADRRFIKFFGEPPAKRTQADARQYCQALGVGYELAAVDSTEVATALSAAGGLWTGLRLAIRNDGGDLKDGWYFESGAVYDKSAVPWESSEMEADSHCALVDIKSEVAAADCESAHFWVCEDLNVREKVSLLFHDSFVVAKAAGYGYDGADGFCQRLGSELATVRDSAENLAIGEAMQSLSVASAWIGVSAKSGEWQTRDNSPLAFEAFRSGEKEQSGASARVILDRAFGRTEWASRHFADESVAGFVCEGYHFSLIHSAEAKSFDDANGVCEALYNSALATVRDVSESTRMRDTLLPFATSAWIGLKDRGEGEFHWLDSSPKTFVDWAKDAPNAADGKQHCAEMNWAAGGQWKDDDCDTKKHAFFCKSHTSEVRTDHVLVPSLTTTFAAAKQYCDEKHGGMYSIHGDADNEHVLASVKAAAASLNFAWIGLSAAQSSQYFEWTDGSARDYDNWAEGSPTVGDVLMSAGSGKWLSVSGPEMRAGVVCALHRAEDNTTTTPPLTPQSTEALAPPSSGLLLEWQLSTGPREVLHGDAQNTFVVGGEDGAGFFTADGFAVCDYEAFAETGALRLPYALSELRSRSIEVVVFLDEQSEDWDMAVVSLDSGNPVCYDAIVTNDELLQFEIGHENGRGLHKGTHSTFARSQREAWRHLVLTLDADNNVEALYRDGVVAEMGTSSVVPTLSADETKLLLGKRDHSCGERLSHCRLNGKIREVRLYGSALSATEVTALFQSSSLAPPSSGLILEWQLRSGLREVLHGNAQNTLVIEQKTNAGVLTSEGLAIFKLNAYAVAGPLQLPFGIKELKSRSIEVRALVRDRYIVHFEEAIASLDSSNPVCFDAIVTKPEHSRYEIGHESGRQLGAERHSGLSETQGQVWRHLILSLDAENQVEALYRDGVAIEQGANNGVPTLSPAETRLLLGKRNDNCGYVDCRFDGVIGEVRLYARALSATDTSALFHGAPLSWLLLEWQLDKGAVNGPKELQHGDAQNTLVIKGNTANAHYTSEGLQFTYADTWAETGLLKLPYGLSQLKGRTIEVIAKIYELNTVSAIVSLDSVYDANGGYTHVAFDGIMYNEANTGQFEIGHEYNRNEGTHTGFAETTANVWRHLVLTQGATTERLYVDGVMTEEMATDNGADLLKTIENKLLFGLRCHHCTYTTDCLLRGVIKLVRVYGKALSHAQVLQL